MINKLRSYYLLKEIINTYYPSVHSKWKKFLLPDSGILRHSRYNYCSKKEDEYSEREKHATVSVVFIDKEKNRYEVQGKVGDSLLDVGRKNEMPIEGACESSLACCTCHVYIQDKFLDKLREPEKREDDMLDMAPFLKPNSRLGCQIILQKDLEGMEVELPPATRNFYVDGHVPEAH